jgi:hypothetical protein
MHINDRQCQLTLRVAAVRIAASRRCIRSKRPGGTFGLRLGTVLMASKGRRSPFPGQNASPDGAAKP